MTKVLRNKIRNFIDYIVPLNDDYCENVEDIRETNWNGSNNHKFINEIENLNCDKHLKSLLL